jgi:hypothetical protein
MPRLPGMTAAIVDESFGGLLLALRQASALPFWGPAFTASLEVAYKAVSSSRAGSVTVSSTLNRFRQIQSRLATPSCYTSDALLRQLAAPLCLCVFACVAVPAASLRCQVKSCFVLCRKSRAELLSCVRVRWRGLRAARFTCALGSVTDPTAEHMQLQRRYSCPQGCAGCLRTA